MLPASERAAAASVEWAHAYDLYQRTNYEASIAILAGLPQADAATLQLAGQNHYMLGDYKKATESLEKAVALAPVRPETLHWLGRAYGRRAETSSVFTAPGFASKARQMFERAVAADPSNRDAVGDLFDYYLEAPGFLGGGENKAAALAEVVAKMEPAEGHYYLAQLDLRRKQFDSAEQHLRSALEIAPRQVGRFLDLATFLGNRGRDRESEALFEEAARLTPGDPKILFGRAKLYIQENRNLSEARKLLERYLQSPLTPNDPPRQEAQALLKKIGA